MKKDIDWLKDEILTDMRYLEGNREIQQLDIKYQTLRGVAQKINSLDEPEVLSQELPSVPQFVAEWYESEGKRSSWWNWFYKWGRDESRSDLETKTIKWMQDYNEEKFVDMFLHGYEVEKEQKYYARIKGWENVTTGSESFNWVYFKEKDTVGISKAVENKYQSVSFTKYDWNNLGINEHNADFVLVEELEE